jgi:phospholipid/cholesterol/gamma-HCH transport system substrate-binding protein
MRKKAGNSIKLGVFVLSGLFFLILLLYMIGRNRNLFGSTFLIKARFENVQGLVPGNNVRYAGIEIGTVKRVNILNDTLIEVVMVVEDNAKQFMRSNAVANIGSDGLMGNKVINISSTGPDAPFIREGDIIVSRKTLDTDEILRTLGKTNNDAAVIAENLKTTVIRINNSSALWKLLNDSTIPLNLKASVENVRYTTDRAAEMANDLNAIISDVKDGKGSLGAVLRDTAIATNLNEAIEKIKLVGDHADELAASINAIVADVKKDMNEGNGPANALLKDSAMVLKLNNSLDNIQKGTDAFSQNMEALKHNFLFRGYFRKLERKKQQDTKKVVVH